MNLQSLLQQIDALSAGDVLQVQERLEARRRALQEQPALSAAEWEAKLRAAFKGFWDGMTPSDIDEAIDAMNGEHIDVDATADWDWLNENPKDVP